MRISARLPIAAAILTLFSIGTTSAVALYAERMALAEQAYQKLEATADGRRNESVAFLGGIETDLKSLAANVETMRALFGFERFWEMLGDKPAEELQKRYIDNNPNSADQLYLLDNAKVDSFDGTHAKYSPAFRDHILVRGYEDVYLFNL